MNKGREKKFWALAYALLISAALPLSQGLESGAEVGAKDMISPTLALLPGLVLLLAMYRSFMKRPRRHFSAGVPARSNRFLMVVAALLTSFLVAARPADPAVRGGETSRREAAVEVAPPRAESDSPMVTDEEDLGVLTVNESFEV